jgi:hypothetical protein
MAFVPEGQSDSSQARSAWNHEENSLVPTGRLNGSRLRSGANDKNVMTTNISGPDKGLTMTSTVSLQMPWFCQAAGYAAT